MLNTSEQAKQGLKVITKLGRIQNQIQKEKNKHRSLFKSTVYIRVGKTYLDATSEYYRYPMYIPWGQWKLFENGTHLPLVSPMQMTNIFCPDYIQTTLLYYSEHKIIFFSGHSINYWASTLAKQHAILDGAFI